MAKDSIFAWDTVAGNNTDVGNVSTAEGSGGMRVPATNDAFREVMEQVASGIASRGSDVASAATLNLDAATTPSLIHDITGAVTATAVTLASGQWRICRAVAAFQMTASASLIINGSTSVNWTTAAGDLLFFEGYAAGVVRVTALRGSSLSLSSANTWTAAQTISSSAAGTLQTLTSTEAGATAGPVLDLYRNSASPAASDVLGQIQFLGKSSTGVQRTFGKVQAKILDATNAGEDGQVEFYSILGGAQSQELTYQWGVYLGAATGGGMGTGTINATEYYKDGVALSANSMTLLGTLTTSSGTTQSLTGIAAGYRELYCEVEGVSFNASASLSLALSSTNGAAYGSAAVIGGATGSAAGTYYGTIRIMMVSSTVAAGKIAQSILRIGNIATVTTDDLDTNTAAVVDAIQFAGGTFDAGTIRIYGVK